MENLSVGNNVSIGYDNFIHAVGGVSIGNNAMLASGVKIWSAYHNINNEDVLISNQKQTLNSVIVGNDIL